MNFIAFSHDYHNIMSKNITDKLCPQNDNFEGIYKLTPRSVRSRSFLDFK